MMTGSNRVSLGNRVPDFSLEYYDPVADECGRLTLEELSQTGKWTVLFFYPADFSFVCTSEFAALAEQQEALSGMGAETITVSTDSTSAHRNWRQENSDLASVAFKMGSDPEGNLAQMFGVRDARSGLALRGTFMLNPEGVLLNIEVNFYNLGRNIDELVRKLKANMYMVGKTIEGCPSKWQDAGDEIL